MKFKKKNILLISFFLVIFFSEISFSQNLKNLTILHWNDFHASNVPSKADKKYYPEIKDSVIYIGGSAYLLGYIKKYKELEKNVVLLDAGDDYQGSPVSTITKGRSQIELLNIIHPDAMTLGNHEFDYSADTLFKFLKDAKFDIISANLLDKTSREPVEKPYKIMTVDGIKIAIIGLMTPQLYSLSFPENIKNLYVDNIFSCTRKYISELKISQKPNVFIILSHCGDDIDQILADSIPAIDIIIGGHSHTILKQPIKRNRTIICQAGDKGKFLGKLDLRIDVSGDSVYSYNGSLIPTINSLITPDPVMMNKVQEFEKLVSKDLNEIIGILETDWVRGHGESNIGNWETDAIKKYTKSDIAFQNSGGIRKNLSAGKITKRDIWEINPFGNQIVTFSISGDSLIKMLEYQLAGKAEVLQVSGLKIKYDPQKPFGEKIISILVDNKKLDPKKIYSIGTNEYVANQGKKFFGFDIDVKNIIKFNLVDREMFIDEVKIQNKINSKIEGRIEEIKK